MANSGMVTPAELKEQVKKILQQIIRFRHELHQIPEIQYQEYKTTAKIRERITRQEIEIEPPLIKTDTVAILKGKDQGKNVTLRADIDALPVEESSGVPWLSRHPGFSHACGHDGHTAILAGTIEVLSTFRERFNGSVRFVFQPAEEQGGGGKRMVEKGLLAREPLPSAVFALHGWPETPLGSVGARSVVETYLDPEAWIDNPPRTMAAEDFSFYLHKVPGAFLRLGLGKEHTPLHNPAFDFNDKALETGITLLTALALETLKAPS